MDHCTKNSDGEEIAVEPELTDICSSGEIRENALCEKNSSAEKAHSTPIEDAREQKDEYVSNKKRPRSRGVWSRATKNPRQTRLRCLTPSGPSKIDYSDGDIVAARLGAKHPWWPAVIHYWPPIMWSEKGRKRIRLVDERVNTAVRWVYSYDAAESSIVSLSQVRPYAEDGKDLIDSSIRALQGTLQKRLQAAADMTERVLQHKSFWPPAIMDVLGLKRPAPRLSDSHGEGEPSVKKKAAKVSGSESSKREKQRAGAEKTDIDNTETIDEALPSDPMKCETTCADNADYSCDATQQLESDDPSLEIQDEEQLLADADELQSVTEIKSKITSEEHQTIGQSAIISERPRLASEAGEQRINTESTEVGRSKISVEESKTGISESNINTEAHQSAVSIPDVGLAVSCSSEEFSSEIQGAAMVPCDEDDS